jgi:hypothetical protein
LKSTTMASERLLFWSGGIAGSSHVTSTNCMGLRDLAAALGRELNAETAILDGELAVPDHRGRTVFASMMKRRRKLGSSHSIFYHSNGDDLRQFRCSLGRNDCDAFCPSVLYMSCMWTILDALALSCTSGLPARPGGHCGETSSEPVG